MATIEQINNVIDKLEQRFGETLHVSNVREYFENVFDPKTPSTPLPTESVPTTNNVVVVEVASSSSTVNTDNDINKDQAINPDFCAGIKKDGKQCTKKGSKTGSDNLKYCATHYASKFGAEPVTTPVVKKVVAEITTKKVAPKATSSSSDESSSSKTKTPSPVAGNTNPVCCHEIKGKNPRMCDSISKAKGSDGQWYCGTHLKSHTGKSGVTSDEKASNLLASLNEASVPVYNEEHGIAVDQRGICFVGDYEDLGVSAFGRMDTGVIVDLTEDDITFCKTHSYPIVSPEGRQKLIGMSAEERSKFTGL